MKIGLFNIDSRKIPNIPLLKIEKYYKREHGASVVWDNKFVINDMDAIFVSCVFSENKPMCDYFENYSKRHPEKNVQIGGSGYSLSTTLPDEIENINLHINIGFTSRGCIRRCPFCVVPRKEGKFRVVGDVYDLWDGISKDITIMDNNIFADYNHFDLVSKQLIDNNLRVDFNQGLDIRLLNDDFAKILKRLIPTRTWTFAFDSLDYKDQFIKGADTLKRHGLISKTQIYFLIGFDSSLEEDIERLKIIKCYNMNTFFMLYGKGERIHGSLSDEDIELIKSVRCPIGNKAKILKIINKSMAENKQPRQMKLI